MQESKQPGNHCPISLFAFGFRIPSVSLVLCLIRLFLVQNRKPLKRLEWRSYGCHVPQAGARGCSQTGFLYCPCQSSSLLFSDFQTEDIEKAGETFRQVQDDKVPTAVFCQNKGLFDTLSSSFSLSTSLPVLPVHPGYPLSNP